MKQLALPFGEPPDYAEADFIEASSNAEARGWLARTGDWSGLRLVLWGQAGCGKTHLLHIWAGAHGATILDGATLTALPPIIGGPIAIDDADAVADEVVLLHLINLAAAAGMPVLLAMRRPPNRQVYAVPDLASRLRASLAVMVQPAEDELLAALLARLAAGRQLHLGIAVQNYLLARLPRTPAVLREAVARLDRAVQQDKQTITRARAAALLQDMIGESEPVT